MVGANWAVSGAEESSVELIQWHRQPLPRPTDWSTVKAGEALGKVFENDLHSSQALCRNQTFHFTRRPGKLQATGFAYLLSRQVSDNILSEQQNPKHSSQTKKTEPLQIIW